MSEIDELRGRVEAAKERLAQSDAQRGQEMADLAQTLETARAQLEAAEGRIQDLESRNLKQVSDNRQLKEMLLALLVSVESRNTERMTSTVRDMGTRLGSMAAKKVPEAEAAAAAAAPEPAPEPEPETASAEPPPEPPEEPRGRELPAGIERMLFSESDEGEEGETSGGSFAKSPPDDDTPQQQLH